MEYSFKGTVLIVDDDPNNLDLLCDLLSGANYRTFVAIDGEQGVNHAQQGQPDIILLDILMPGIDGFETCKRLKANPETKDIPIIFLSAVTEMDNKVKGFKLGAADFITKPFQKEEVLARIDTHITIRRQQLKMLELNRQLTEEIQQKVNTEKALRESEEQYRAIADNIGDYIMRYDRGLRLIYANQNALEVTGLSVDQCIGKTHREMGFPEHLCDLWEKNIKLVFDTGKQQIIEFEVELAKGSMIFELQLNPEFTADGSVKSVIGISRDISKHIKTEKELMKSEKKYRRIFENSIVGFFQSTPEGRFTNVNPAFAKMLGYESCEDLISNISDIETQYYVNPEDRHRYKQIIKKNEKVDGFEFKARCKDGSKIWVSNSTRAYFDDDKIIRYEGVAIDITKRRLAEEMLQKKTDDLGERVKELNCLYSISNFLLENPGISMEEIFQKIAEFITSAWQYPEITCSRLIISGNQYKTDNFKETKWKQSSKILVNNEQVGTVEVCYLKERAKMDEGPFMKEERNLINFIAGRISHIIEERQASENKKNLETQLRQTQKMEAIGTLAGGIAHDFNNILFSIFAFAETIQKDLSDDDPLQEYIGEVLVGARRARDLVKQILTFSRQTEVELRPVKIQIILKEVIKLIRSSLPSTIKIKQNINPECGMTLADSTEIHQVIMNLITNAYHAMNDGGGILSIELKEVDFTNRVDIDSKLEPDRYVCLSISDTGIGMEKNILDKIFDPYFTTKEKGKGTGLGLSVVNGIVKNYKGEIIVDSKPGEGTCFKVYLPLYLSDYKAIQEQSKLPIPKGNERILVIDDDKMILKAAKITLGQLGYKVTTILNPIDAVDDFRSQPEKYDLVITDMIMPGLTGNMVAAVLMTIRPNIPIIICAGYSEKIPEVKAEAIGIKGFLMKPVLTSELAHMIRNVLDKN